MTVQNTTFLSLLGDIGERHRGFVGTRRKRVPTRAGMRDADVFCRGSIDGVVQNPASIAAMGNASQLFAETTLRAGRDAGDRDLSPLRRGMTSFEECAGPNQQMVECGNPSQIAEWTANGLRNPDRRRH
jgi:hypothetical protein